MFSHEHLLPIVHQMQQIYKQLSSSREDRVLLVITDDLNILLDRPLCVGDVLSPQLNLSQTELLVNIYGHPAHRGCLTWFLAEESILGSGAVTRGWTATVLSWPDYQSALLLNLKIQRAAVFGVQTN
ncbi:unnamed protein product [Arctogadus glacialis]